MAAAVPFIPYLIAGAGMLAGGLANRNMAEYQADASEQEGEMATAQSEAEQARLARQARLLSARQQAGYAAAGVQLTGTPIDVIAGDAVQSELDVLNARYAGQVRATGAKANARAFRQSGKQALIASAISAGTILTAGYSKYTSSQPPLVQASRDINRGFSSGAIPF